MRLGKTLTAIRRVAHTGTHQHVLVVVPTTAGMAWEKELGLEGIKFARLSGPTKKKWKTYWEARNSGVSWFIINPEGLRAAPGFGKMGWDWVIADECTFMKSAKASITKIMRTVQSSQRMILTGLLCPESAADAWCPMAWLLGGEFMGAKNFYVWRQKYMQATYFSWELKPKASKQIMQEISKHAYVMTAQEAGVFTPKVHQYIELPIDAKQLKAYKHCEKMWEVGSRTTRISVVAQQWMRCIAAGIPAADVETPGSNGSKLTSTIKALCDFLHDNFNQRIVVFYNFTAQMDLIATGLKARKEKFATIGGIDDSAARSKKVDAFQNGKIRIILVEETIGRFGIDLSNGTMIVFASNAWDYETRAQAIRRCDNVKKSQPVYIVDAVVRDTVSEDVALILNEKKMVAENFNENLRKRIEARGGRWQ